MNRLTGLFSSTHTIVASNTISQLAGRMVGSFTTFVITLILARQLGASGYGDFVKITTYIAFFFLLADFGINALYLQQAKNSHAWSALLSLRICLGILLGVVAICLLAFVPVGATQGYTSFVRWGILLYSPAIFFQALTTTGNAMFQYRLRYDLSAWALVLGSLVSLGCLWVIFFLSPTITVIHAVIILLVGAAVTAVSSLFFAQKLHRVYHFSFSKKDMLQLLVPSIPLGVTLLFNLVYFHADSVIITMTRPTSEVGVYGLAYKVFELMLILPTFFMNAVYPLMVQHAAVDGKHSTFKKIIFQSTLFLLSASLFAFAAAWFAAPFLSVIKSDFAASVGALRALSFGLPFFFVSSVMMWALIALKKQRVLVGVYGVSMIANIVGNIFFVPTYGYMAAAWITGVSEGIVLFLSSIILWKTFTNKEEFI